MRRPGADRGQQQRRKRDDGPGRQVRKIICSFPRQRDSFVFEELYHSGKIELEVVPQGNLAERIRAAGAGIGAFYTPTGVGAMLAEGKETRRIDGRDHLLEYPIHADVALIRAHTADRLGSLVYRETGRNFGPIMATAARLTVAVVVQVVPVGDLDPEVVVTPGIFVNRVLGAFQVAADGTLANWHTGAPGAIPAVGGAMDLAAGARDVFVKMTLFDRDGAPNLVRECDCPVTGLRCVSRVYTDHAVFHITPEGVDIAETYGITRADLDARPKL